MSWIEAAKRRAAEKAVLHIESGSVIGLGSGSTAAHAIRVLGVRLRSGELKEVLGVPTSLQATAEAISASVPITTLDEHPDVDLTIDGADQIDKALNVIKGGGGALLKEKIVASDVTAGAFTKVFGVLDRNIGEAKQDDAKRKWRAIKAMLSKVLSNLPVKKADTEDFDAFVAGLATVETAVDTLVKTQPKVGADNFKPIVAALDKLIGAAEGSAKKALMTIKSTLSKLMSDAYAPAPSAQEKGLDLNDAEELALIAQNVEDIVTKLDKFEARMAKVEKAMDKIPVHKGLNKEETPRAQGED